MSKKREICAICGTFDFSQTQTKPKKKGGIPIEHNNDGKVIYTVHYHNSKLGKYAQLHLAYLREYQPRFYIQLMATDKLHSWLCEIEEIAKRRFEFAEKYNRPFDETEHSLFTEVIYNQNNVNTPNMCRKYRNSEMEDYMKNDNSKNHMKITALYERLSIGDEQRGNGESNSIQNQKIQLEDYAKQQGFTNIRHYTDDDESGRFFDRTGYTQMIEDVESGKIGVVIMKDLTRWGRDHVQVGIAMETFRLNNVRFIAINHGIDSINPQTLEMAPFINIMSEWFAKDTLKKIRSVFKAKGMAGKHVGSIPPYGYAKCSENKDLWIVDEPAAAIVRRIFQLTLDGKGPYQICTILCNEKIPIPAYYQAQQNIGLWKNRQIKDPYAWNSSTVTAILEKREYCGDTVNFKTRKHIKDKKSHYVDESEWVIFSDTHEPIIDRPTYENCKRIRNNNKRRRPNGWGYVHPLSGLLFCADCGGKLYIHCIYNGQDKPTADRNITLNTYAHIIKSKEIQAANKMEMFYPKTVEDNGTKMLH